MYASYGIATAQDFGVIIGTAIGDAMANAIAKREPELCAAVMAPVSSRRTAVCSSRAGEL